MTLATPRAVIFDWDNTLVDTWPIIHHALNATFEATGKPLWTFEETKSRVRKSMRDSFPEIFGANWQEAGALYQQHYRANHLRDLKPLPGAEAVLRRVRERGLYSVIVSNKKGPNLRTEAEHMGWMALLDKVVGADDAARDKPHRDPVLLAFEKSPIRPGADVWFIGDSEIDLECALNCGCTAILYGPDAKSHPQYSASHFLGFPYHAHAHAHDETLALFA